MSSKWLNLIGSNRNTKSRLSVTPYNSIKIIVLFILTLAISRAVVWAIGRNKMLESGANDQL